MSTPEQLAKRAAYMREYNKRITPEQRKKRNARVREHKRKVYNDPDVQIRLKESRRKSYAKHRDKRIAEVKQYVENFKRQCYDYYGRICKCCSESAEGFLTIDHMNNDGAAHRKEIGSNKIYKWLVTNNFLEGFQVLCYNCNCGRQRNKGVCPHKMLERS